MALSSFTASQQLDRICEAKCGRGDTLRIMTSKKIRIIIIMMNISTAPDLTYKAGAKRVRKRDRQLYEFGRGEWDKKKNNRRKDCRRAC